MAKVDSTQVGLNYYPERFKDAFEVAVTTVDGVYVTFFDGDKEPEARKHYGTIGLGLYLSRYHKNFVRSADIPLTPRAIGGMIHGLNSMLLTISQATNIDPVESRGLWSKLTEVCGANSAIARLLDIAITHGAMDALVDWADQLSPDTVNPIQLEASQDE